MQHVACGSLPSTQSDHSAGITDCGQCRPTGVVPVQCLALFMLLFDVGSSEVKIRVEKQIGSQVLSFETGQLGKQAAACVMAQYGDTIVLSAVATGPSRPGTDFFPLTCDYRERMAAAGKFPGGFLKREGRPTTKETLTSRLIDRPIRPLFPKGFNDEVQIQCMVVSSDLINDADVIAMNGAAAALLITPLPFKGLLLRCAWRGSTEN